MSSYIDKSVENKTSESRTLVGAESKKNRRGTKTKSKHSIVEKVIAEQLPITILDENDTYEEEL